MTVEVFAHPVSFRRAADAEAERLAAYGADRVCLAFSYHSGRWLLTTSEPAGVVDFPAGRWFATPAREETGPGEALSLPVLGDEATTASAALVRSGVAVTAWLVGLHQSYLAMCHPELALRNAFGHRYRHALCPAALRVRQYAHALVSDAVRIPGVSGVELEAFGYLGWQHASAHDKYGTVLRPVDRWLLSLCFCPACSARFIEAGIDVAEVRMRTRAAILAQLAEPVGADLDDLDGLADFEDLDAPPGIADLASAALGHELHDAVVAVRSDVTTDLVREATAAAGGMPVSVRATSDPYACNGKSAGDLGELAAAAGGLTVTDLTGRTARLREDLAAAGRTGATVRAGWSLCAAHTADEDELAGIGRLAHEHRAASLALYAYDLFPAPRLNWLRRLPGAPDAPAALTAAPSDRETTP
ncbi:hypothetical protein [Streptomyces sp. MAR4 CNX-425]|uniref:hypothetical protein n=1 Tax=Streptomyces sp. MAR4 CNX-425 TaxID=3406343 RepID=UPI003B50C28B